MSPTILANPTAMVAGSYVAAWRRGQAALQQPSGLRMCSVREPTWYVVNVTSAVILPQREHSWGMLVSTLTSSSVYERSYFCPVMRPHARAGGGAGAGE